MNYSDYGYLEPVHIKWRAGKDDDPYVDKSDFIKIVNQVIVLTEIPSKEHRVKITGMIEVNFDKIRKNKLEKNEFLVHYESGIVQFHKDREGETVNPIYKGRGFILYPSSRIYHKGEYDGAVRTLYDIIEQSERFIEEVESVKEDYEQIKQHMIEVIENAIKDTEVAVDNAIKATDDAKTATDMALDAYKTTRLVFMPYVADMKELTQTYPFPQVGWTVQTYKDGNRYRWDGKDWVAIDIFGKNIQVVNEFVAGLMSTDEHVKLKSFPVELKDRVIVFCMPSYLIQGVQSVIARFPFNGEIVSVKALCGVAGETDTEIAIEKSINLVHWTNVLTKNIVIGSNRYFDDGKQVINNNNVTAGDMFRLNVIRQGMNIQNVTVEVIIKI